MGRCLIPTDMNDLMTGISGRFSNNAFATVLSGCEGGHLFSVKAPSPVRLNPPGKAQARNKPRMHALETREMVA
jgi:hypothetical protein